MVSYGYEEILKYGEHTRQFIDCTGEVLDNSILAECCFEYELYWKNMKKHLLVLHLEIDFGEDLMVSANNELDMREYLTKEGWTDIEFRDIESNYGTCSMENMYGIETAKCFYVEKI